MCLLNDRWYLKVAPNLVKISTKSFCILFLILGVEEAKHLKDWLTGIAPNAIIISPLSRAIQTYCHMRQGTEFATTIWAEPRISELASDGSHENMGRRLKDLREDWVLNMLEDPFNEIDFSRIEYFNIKIIFFLKY